MKIEIILSSKESTKKPRFPPAGLFIALNFGFLPAGTVVVHAQVGVVLFACIVLRYLVFKEPWHLPKLVLGKNKMALFCIKRFF